MSQSHQLQRAPTFPPLASHYNPDSFTSASAAASLTHLPPYAGSKTPNWAIDRIWWHNRDSNTNIAVGLPPTSYSKDSSILEAMRKDTLTRKRITTTPTLSHLLSIGNGRVLALAADEKHVYAGCSSRENEITVFSRTSFQPLFRLLGHEGSVLALRIVKEKGWLISSSSAGDVRIWCTTTLQPLYVIRPCDDTSGNVYSLAWDERHGGTLYFGAQSTAIEWVNFASTPDNSFPAPSLSAGVATVIASAATLSLEDAVPTPSSTPPLGISGADSKRSSLGHSTPGQRSGRYKPSAFFNVPSSFYGASPSGTSTPTGVCESLHRTRSNASDPVKDASNDANGEGSEKSDVVQIDIEIETTMFNAHYGYVYALQMIPRPNGGMWLASGSGDSDVKVWNCAPGGGLQLVREFQGLSGAVLSLTTRDSLLFAGLQGGEVDVWDLEQGARIRTIECQEADIMAMATLGCDVFIGAADGTVMRIDESFDCTAAFQAHSAVVLATTIVPGHRKGWELVTAGNGPHIKIWDLPVLGRKSIHDTDVDVDFESGADPMMYALSKLVAIPTVSDDEHRESCRQGAHLLNKILDQLGAQSEIISGDPGRNPLVLATFAGRDTGKPRKRVLFYGHYDVQPATESAWESSPWEMTGRNGYLYGRGVSDNKGPVLAVACAAAALRQRRELDVDLVMLVEGEEEAGSRGFASAVRRNKHMIGQVDAILLSNSTWVNEDDPCIVYGMRGVVYANLTVKSQSDNAHNGVEGGAVAEPMFDLVRLLGGLADSEGLKVPGFYDSVRKMTPEELALLVDVARASGRPSADLERVWRNPTFSIANITASGAANKTVIPGCVTADITMRIVPDQDLDTIISSFTSHCQSTFDKLGTPNELSVCITHAASWWLASLDNPYFRQLEEAIKDVWGEKPLKIREGGTVPTMSWLEHEFAAPCVHLPLGQSSDAGHLANERMRLSNLRNGRRVVERYLVRLGQI